MNTEDKRTFRLRKARLDAGLTQVELAAKAGVSVNTLIRLERDEQAEWPRKTIRVLIDLARVLKVNPLELYNEITYQEGDEHGDH